MRLYWEKISHLHLYNPTLTSWRSAIAYAANDSDFGRKPKARPEARSGNSGFAESSEAVWSAGSV
jgi:hypothetical protein